MNVKEWEEEKFKQAIMRGLDDYCKGDICGLRNESISKQFCPCFLNNSAFSATQVIIIGKPVASPSNHTKVDFVVILRPVSSSKPLVVLNTTLEHIVWERANSISKHLNKTVLVNNLPPSSDTRCNDVKSVEKEEKRKSKNTAIAIAITPVVVILLVSVVVALWYRRKRNIPANQLRDDNEEENDDECEFGHLADQRENQQRDNNGEENNGGNEFDPREEQRDNNRDGNDGGYEVIPPAGQRENQQRNNYREGNDGGYEAVHPARQRENQQRGNNRKGNNGS